jgi:heme-degrading monooxygenase HmoA
VLPASGTDDRRIMIAHIAIHRPNPESVDDLIASMERFAAAGRSQPGLQEVHTMRDAESGTLLGLALWETREAFDRGCSGDAGRRRRRPLRRVGEHPTRRVHLRRRLNVRTPTRLGREMFSPSMAAPTILTPPTSPTFERTLERRRER